MAEHADIFDRLARFSDALNELRQRAELDRPMEEVLEDFQISLEELRVADEEMREQNEQLLAARQSQLEQAQHYVQLFNFAPDGYVVTDQDARIEAANYMASALLRAPSQHLVGKPLATFIAPQDLGAFWSRLRRALEARPGVVDSLEVEAQPRDRPTFPCAMRVAAARDAQGNVTGVRWLLRDISERKLMEEALRLSEERNRLLLNSMRYHAVYMTDAQGLIVSWNSGAQRITGYTGREIIGQSFAVLLPPEQAGSVDERLIRTVALGRLETEDWRIRSDGTAFLADEVITTLRNAAGELVGFSCVLRDVTERKQAEDQMRSLNADLTERVDRRTTQLADAQKDLEDLSYSVSHDLRSPLRAIDGFAQMLLEDYGDKVDAEGQRRLTVVKDNSRKMSQLIDGLLVFSRTGRRELRFLEIDLTAVAWQVVREVSVALPADEARFEVLDLPPACCDRSAVHDVLLNLVGNAVKFSRTREQPLIQIGGRPEAGENVYWVRDNGIGFDEAYAGQLFGMFRRLHVPTEVAGPGVGLAVVKRIVTRHGGRVWATGQVDAGATFYFTLPNRKNREECADDR
jgi:PAS domain S-box-containing protein